MSVDTIVFVCVLIAAPFYAAEQMVLGHVVIEVESQGLRVSI